MAQYMLLLYDNPANWTKLNPQEIQKAMGKYQSFRQMLKDKKLWVSSHKLADEPGKVLRGNANSLKVSDGPYSETKEWLGGYYLIEAPNYKAAVELARACPHLEYGGTVEVREVDPMVAAASSKA
jgi:hypothetical protein